MTWLLLVWLLFMAVTTTAAQSGDEPRPSASPDDLLDEPLDSPSKSKPIASEVLEKLLARYALEPSVEQVVTAALKAARADPQHFVDLAGRARLRGLLPHLDLGVRRGQGIDLRWTPTDELAGNRTTADDVMLFATLRFDLDRLLFSSDEVSLAREQRFAQHEQRELIRKVVHVYYLRRRLLLERDLLGGSSIAHQLRIEEAEALLDTFTDGAFQRMLRVVRGKQAQAPTLPGSDRR